MADPYCSQCGHPFGADELFCPHCGAAQIPQATRTELGQAMGREREGPSRVPLGLGCLLGLMVGIVVAALLGFDSADDARLRYKQQAEIVFLMMIGGIVLGLVYMQWRAVRRRKKSGKADADG